MPGRAIGIQKPLHVNIGCIRCGLLAMHVLDISNRAQDNRAAGIPLPDAIRAAHGPELPMEYSATPVHSSEPEHSQEAFCVSMKA